MFLACVISFKYGSGDDSSESFGMLDDCLCDNPEICDYFCRRSCEDLRENKRRKESGESY